MSVVALALVHHPVLGRHGETLTTTITTIDLHDLTRSARTYGLARVYAVHPIDAQRQLADRVRDHWVDGSGRRRIPDRAAALELLRTVPTLRAAWEHLAPEAGRAGVELWTTAARTQGTVATPFAAARRRLERAARPILLCLGTGWGLTDELIGDADVHLEPIRGAPGVDYNHLSVRAAAAIALDRLLG